MRELLHIMLTLRLAATAIVVVAVGSLYTSEGRATRWSYYRGDIASARAISGSLSTTEAVSVGTTAHEGETAYGGALARSLDDRYGIDVLETEATDGTFHFEVATTEPSAPIQVIATRPSPCA